MFQERAKPLMVEEGKQLRTKREGALTSIHASPEEDELQLERRDLEESLEQVLSSLRLSGGEIGFADKIHTTQSLLRFGEDGRVTAEVRKRARWIVDWVIQKTKNPSATSADDQEVNEADLLKELFFSYSPCVFSYLKKADQISVLARSSRNEVLQGTLVQPFIGEVVYELSYADSPERILQENWSSSSLSDKLDFIDFAPTLFAQAEAQGKWASPCAMAVEQLLQNIQIKEKSFFIGALASESMRRIEVEKRQPSAGVVQRVGDRRVGRMEVDKHQMLEEDAALKQKILVEKSNDRTLRRISRDAIAAFDHAAIPQGYIPLSKQAEEALPVLETDGALIENIDGWLARPPHLLRPQAKWWCLMNIQNTLLPKAETTGNAWEKRLPVLSTEEWDRYWMLEEEQRETHEVIRALRALQDPTKQEQEQLRVSLWKSGLIDEKLQPLTDRVYRDPSLQRVMQSILQEIPRPVPVHLTPFEEFEGQRELMPKGERAGIQAAVLLQVMHRPFVREKLEEQIGISLQDLSLREQIQFLSFLAQGEQEKQHQVFKLIKEFGVPAARSFLSCEYDPKMGEVILQLARERRREEVNEVFERYSALVERAAASSQELQKQFYVGIEGGVVSRELFEDSLLGRAKQLITEASKKKEAPLEGVLKGYAEDLAVFVSLFKSVFKGARTAIPFEAIRGLSIESLELQALTSEKKRATYEELLPLIKENWTRTDTDVGEGVVKRFEDLFNQPGKASTFFVLRREGEVAAFVRFDDRPDLGENAVYAGSLNVSKSFQDSGIGGSFVREMVEQRIGNKELYADVLASDAVGSFYVEELGCVIDGVKRPAGGGDAFFSLRRSQELNTVLKTKKEQIYLLGDGASSGAFDLPVEKERFVHWVEEATQKNQLITRYQISRLPTGEQRRFLIAESIPPERAISAQLTQVA